MQKKLIIAKRSLNLAPLAWKVRTFGTRKLLVNEADFMLIIKTSRKDKLNSLFSVLKHLL